MVQAEGCRDGSRHPSTAQPAGGAPRRSAAHALTRARRRVRRAHPEQARSSTRCSSGARRPAPEARLRCLAGAETERGPLVRLWYPGLSCAFARGVVVVSTVRRSRTAKGLARGVFCPIISFVYIIYVMRILATSRSVTTFGSGAEPRCSPRIVHAGYAQVPNSPSGAEKSGCQRRTSVSQSSICESTSSTLLSSEVGASSANCAIAWTTSSGSM